jgi:hypothetical protein
MLTGTIAFSGAAGGASAACRAQLLAARVVADVRPARPDRRVERRPRRGREDVLGDGAEQPLGAAHGAADGRLRVRHGVRAGAQRADAVLDRLLHRVQRPAQRPWAPPRLPAHRGLRDHVGLGIEDEAHDLQRGEPVHERVMDLADHPDAPVLEVRDEEDLPQRPRAVQRGRQDRRAQRLEARVAHLVVGLGQRHDVGGEVEVGVVDPARLGQAERRVVQAPATPGHLVQAPRRALAQRFDGRARLIARRSEDGAEADVHVRLRGLQAQERAVDGRQPPAVICVGAVHAARGCGAVLAVGLRCRDAHVASL